MPEEDDIIHASNNTTIIKMKLLNECTPEKIEQLLNKHYEIDIIVRDLIDIDQTNWVDDHYKEIAMSIVNIFEGELLETYYEPHGGEIRRKFENELHKCREILGKTRKKNQKRKNVENLSSTKRVCIEDPKVTESLKWLDANNNGSSLVATVEHWKTTFKWRITWMQENVEKNVVQIRCQH
ncbi:hypothetical protein HCN44_007867 [Aphidius gifuensis]|uniref:Uncharacterized protein n=1 Tax=Aphidius gifuensis TaxID=684658 RepID=A0A835CRY9_APHGI|nr:hypothetical protein HCN44_007867 [Aphidius gifuensis]